MTARAGGERLSPILSHAPSAATATLPVPLTAFIGRGAELAELRRLIGEVRLLTLTGAGGSGKTRLALALADALASAPTDVGEPVDWVELAPLADADALAAHVALALGIRVEGAASAEQAIVARIGARPQLLVLDNCEHVVDACARFATTLLASCPRLRLLATSREALGVGGERSWLVPPLALPAAGAGHGLEAIADSPAVQLFVARARDVSRRFALTDENAGDVLRICRRLDGSPLAIELAAARVAVLTPAQIASRLDDRFSLLTSASRVTSPRQRTLRSTVDWSYDLLGAEERILLERLSVFAGPFTLDAAEAVCAGGAIPAAKLLDLLAALATKSLLAMQEEGGEARYRLLETIREYATERRRARGEDASVEERHALHFLALARAAEPELLLGRTARMQAIDLAHDDLLAALGWSAAHREGTRVGLPMVWALLWYWFHRQLWREGFAQAERALATAEAPPPELRAAALHGMGLFGMYARDPLSSDRLAEAQRLWKAAGIERWQAFTSLVETVAASLRKDVEAAKGHATRMLEIARRQPDPWDAAIAKAHGMVPVLVWQEQWAEASRLLDEALATFRALRYSIGIAYALDAQAFVSLQLGDVSRAVRLAAASLREWTQGENRWLAGRSLRILGAVAVKRDDLARAVRLFAAADAMYEAIGAASLTSERRQVNELPHRLRETMSPEKFAAEWEAGRALRFREAVAYALEAADREPASDVAVAAASVATADSVDEAAAAPTTSQRAAEPVEHPALEVRALGRLEIVRAGVPLPPEAWPYAKPRELLLYLLAHPEGRTREQVGLDFWPEISAAQVKNNFHVTLHHLRRAVGEGVAIRFERGRYRVAMEEGVSFDAARFEADATAALKRLRAVPSDEAAGRALADALALHRGAFLEEEQAGDWHLAIRDRIARLYEDGLERLAAHHESRGGHGAAAEVHRRLVALDPLHEEAVRRLMLALARDGRRTDAITTYDRFVRSSREELDAAPEPATVTLADRIRKGTIP